MNLQLTKTSRGMTTAEVLKSLAMENQCIGAIFYFSYSHPTLLQQRLSLTTDEQAILSKAAALRSASKLPFWEALMLSCFGEQRDFTRLLREATFHQSHKKELVRVSRDQVLAGRLDELANTHIPDSHVSISSKLEMADEGHMHLPLMDFHCPESLENDRLLFEVCKDIFRGTALVLSSGESYHAIGLDVLDENTFREFLTRALLFAPIVDARYVAHQMLEGECALRLSSSRSKPNRPRLKFVVTDNHTH